MIWLIDYTLLLKQRWHIGLLLEHPTSRLGWGCTRVCSVTLPAILAVSSPPPPKLVASCLTNWRPTLDKTQLHHLDSDCFTLLSCVYATRSFSAPAKDAQMHQPERGAIAMQMPGWRQIIPASNFWKNALLTRERSRAREVHTNTIQRYVSVQSTYKQKCYRTQVFLPPRQVKSCPGRHRSLQQHQASWVQITPLPIGYHLQWCLFKLFFSSEVRYNKDTCQHHFLKTLWIIIERGQIAQILLFFLNDLASAVLWNRIAIPTSCL